MRNLTLHSMLAEFAAEAGARLDLAASAEGIPFDVVESGDRVPLYCYRPLTGEFIRARLGLLAALPSYVSAVRALEGVGGMEPYLRARGEFPIPDGPRDQADAVLHRLLARVFDERSEFGFDQERFDSAYGELERAIYDGRCVTEVIAPLLGIDLDPNTDELALGEGLSIVRPSALTAAPAELAAPDGPSLLLLLRVAHERLEQPSIAYARTRFRRVLTALRLYERGSYAIGQLGYSRIDDGIWTPAPLGNGGSSRSLTLISVDSEDELRGFCNLIGRRLPKAQAERSGSGELLWALARFEMGCDRVSPFEALTDHLLALRALLEPEGPNSGRLAQRLAVICATPEERAELSERAARAIALEHSVIAGLAPAVSDTDTLIGEITEHLRAILRDLLCGHLDADVRALADDLLEQAADELTVSSVGG